VHEIYYSPYYGIYETPLWNFGAAPRNGGGPRTTNRTEGLVSVSADAQTFDPAKSPMGENEAPDEEPLKPLRTQADLMLVEDVVRLTAAEILQSELVTLP